MRVGEWAGGRAGGPHAVWPLMPRAAHGRAPHAARPMRRAWARTMRSRKRMTAGVALMPKRRCTSGLVPTSTCARARRRARGWASGRQGASAPAAKTAWGAACRRSARGREGRRGAHVPPCPPLHLDPTTLETAPLQTQRGAPAPRRPPQARPTRPRAASASRPQQTRQTAPACGGPADTERRALKRGDWCRLGCASRAARRALPPRRRRQRLRARARQTAVRFGCGHMRARPPPSRSA